MKTNLFLPLAVDADAVVDVIAKSDAVVTDRDAEDTYIDTDVTVTGGTSTTAWIAEAGTETESKNQNLCTQVRLSCQQWYDAHTDCVSIQDEALEALANEMMHIKKTAKLVEWDEEGWHYAPPNQWPATIRRERIALYILALDAINFAFWTGHHDHDHRTSAKGERRYEYQNLATAMTAAARRDHEQQESYLTALSNSYVFSAQSLSTMTVDRMKQVLQDPNDTETTSHFLPSDMDKRCALWNEVGRILLLHFQGSAWNLIQRAQGSESAAVRLLFDYFPGFRDIALVPINSWAVLTEKDGDSDQDLLLKKVDDDDDPTTIICFGNTIDEAPPCQTRTIYFLKRAQICVGDWKASLALYWPSATAAEATATQTPKTNQKIQQDGLTTFADYRLPQLMRERGVLQYCTELVQAVDTYQELPAGCMAEISIRAATVVAVERLVEYMNEYSKSDADQSKLEQQQQEPWTAVSVDWYLWQVGERLEASGALKPHHRVRTTFY